MIKQNRIMNPDHPRWQEFLNRLEGPEGCDFQQSNPDDVRSITWTCKGGRNKDFAKAILKTMPNIDIERSLQFFEDHGGYCDCEILFNVEQRCS